MLEDDDSSQFEVSESLLFWRAQFATINPLEPIDVNDTLVKPTIDKDVVRSLKGVLKQWEDSAKESSKFSGQGVESYSLHTRPVLQIEKPQPTIQIEPETKRKRPSTFQRDESNSSSSANIEMIKQYSISEHKVHSEYSSLSQIDGIDVSLCQLPDTLARLLRDETHPGTRFTCLEEITNFKYRLKYLNVNVTEMFLYIIRQIQEVETKFSSSNNSSFLASAGFSSASSFLTPPSTAVAKIHDEKVAVDPYDPATSFSNTLVGVSREAKEAEVLQYAGLNSLLTETSSIVNQRNLIGKAFHKVMEILAQLTKQKKITLASVLGITLLTTQPALTYSIKTMYGSSLTIKEPKFKVVTSNSGTLMGIDEAIAGVLIIPHPFNLLLYDTRSSSGFALNRVETIAYTESVFMVSRLLEALGQQLFDTTAFTALSITSKLPKGKNHNLRKWETTFPAGDVQPNSVDVTKWLVPARRLLQYTILNRNYSRHLEGRGLMEIQLMVQAFTSSSSYAASSSVCGIRCGLMVEDDFIRKLSPQVIQQLLYVEQLVNESSFDSLYAVHGNNIENKDGTSSSISGNETQHVSSQIHLFSNNKELSSSSTYYKVDASRVRELPTKNQICHNINLIESTEATATASAYQINYDIPAMSNNVSCILPAPVQKTINFSNATDCLHIDDSDVRNDDTNDYDDIEGDDNNHGGDGIPHSVVVNNFNINYGNAGSYSNGASCNNGSIDHKSTSFQHSSRSIKRWTDEENEKLQNLVKTYRYDGVCRWNLVAKKFPWQSEKQCYDQWLFITQNDAWSAQEDAALVKAYKACDNISSTNNNNNNNNNNNTNDLDKVDYINYVSKNTKNCGNISNNKVDIDDDERDIDTSEIMFLDAQLNAQTRKLPEVCAVVVELPKFHHHHHSPPIICTTATSATTSTKNIVDENDNKVEGVGKGKIKPQVIKKQWTLAQLLQAADDSDADSIIGKNGTNDDDDDDAMHVDDAVISSIINAYVSAGSGNTINKSSLSGRSCTSTSTSTSSNNSNIINNNNNNYSVRDGSSSGDTAVKPSPNCNGSSNNDKGLTGNATNSNTNRSSNSNRSITNRTSSHINISDSSSSSGSNSSNNSVNNSNTVTAKKVKLSVMASANNNSNSNRSSSSASHSSSDNNSSSKSITIFASPQNNNIIQAITTAKSAYPQSRLSPSCSTTPSSQQSSSQSSSSSSFSSSSPAITTTTQQHCFPSFSFSHYSHKLPDLSDRLNRDEMYHHTTRFTTLEEITNFKHRLKKASVLTRQLLFRLISIIPNSSPSSTQRNNNNDVANNNTNANHDGDEEIDYIDDESSLNTILNHDGIFPRLYSSACHVIFQQLMQMLTQQRSKTIEALATVLGITMIKTQPWSAIKYKIASISNNCNNGSGGYITIHEPRFRSVMDAPSNLKGLSEAVSAFLMIPHPLNLLVYQQQPPPPLPLNANSITNSSSGGSNVSSALTSLNSSGNKRGMKRHLSPSSSSSASTKLISSDIAMKDVHVLMLLPQPLVESPVLCATRLLEALGRHIQDTQSFTAGSIHQQQQKQRGSNKQPSSIQRSNSTHNSLSSQFVWTVGDDDNDNNISGIELLTSWLQPARRLLKQVTSNNASNSSKQTRMNSSPNNNIKITNATATTSIDIVTQLSSESFLSLFRVEELQPEKYLSDLALLLVTKSVYNSNTTISNNSSVNHNTNSRRR